MHAFLHILGIVILAVVFLGVVGNFLFAAGDQANRGEPFR